MNNILISFIIPVFNCEKYLRRCVDSIVDNNFHSFEILIIDDGSTDSSGVISNELAHINKCVRVIHQNNRGVSGARNTGICNAKGEYIFFVDADDYLLKADTRKLYFDIKKGVDVIIMNYNYNNTCNIKFNYPDGIYNNEFVLLKMFEGLIPWTPWSYCAKKRIYTDYTIFFDRSLNFAEDLKVTFQVFKSSSSFSFLSLPFYCYNLNEGSVSVLSNYDSSILLKHISDLISVEEYIEEETSFFPTLSNHWELQTIRAYFNLLVDITLIKDKCDSLLAKKNQLRSFILNHSPELTVLSLKDRVRILAVKFHIVNWGIFAKIYKKVSRF